MGTPREINHVFMPAVRSKRPLSGIGKSAFGCATARRSIEEHKPLSDGDKRPD